MGPERNGYEQARRMNDNERVHVVPQDDGEDWPLMAALLAGLTVALLANTFLGLIPG